MGINRGEEVHGETTSTDASAGTLTLNLFTQAGNARTLTSTQVLNVTDLNFISATGGAISIGAFNDNQSKSMFLFKGSVIANGGVSRNWSSPFAVPRGWVLRVKAPAGQVDVQMEGYISY